MQERSIAAITTMLVTIVFATTIGMGDALAQAQCASDQYTYTFTNYCSIPVWVGESADASNLRSYPPQGGNWELARQCTANSDCTSGTCDTNVGQCTCTTSSDCTLDPTPGGAICQANGRCASTSTFCMPKTWTSGTFWPRTVCTAPDGTHLNCQTGQCTASSAVNGLLDCGVGITSPINPVTQFEVTSATPAGATNYANYDVSLVAGENVEMKVTAVGGSVPLPRLFLSDSVACYVAGCSDNLNATCPTNLQVKSGSTVIGCLDPCTQCQRSAPGSSTYNALMCGQTINVDSLGGQPVTTTNCSDVTAGMPTYQDMYCVQNFVEGTRATNPISNAQASSNQGTPTAFSQADCFPGTTFIVPTYPNGYKPPGGVCLDASPQLPNTTPNVNDYGWTPFGLPATNCNVQSDLTACGGYLTTQASYANALGYACHTVTYADNGNNAQTAHLCLPPVTSGLGTCTYDSNNQNPLYTGVGGVFNATWLQAGLQAGSGGTPYYQIFKNACGGAYSWQYDDAASGFACYATPLPSGGAEFSGFNVSFCGSQAPAGPSIVYKPLQPCRIMDTRNASPGSGVQGPINGNTLYHIPGFIAAGSDWSQYGATVNPSNCALTNPPGSAIHALALVITILDPNYDAYLGVSDINDLTTTLSTVALNYTRGQGLSTMYLVPQASSNNIYFALPPQVTANLLFDVVGYSVLPDATPLQCTTQASGVTTIAALGGSGTVTSPACSAAYTLTSGSCDSDSPSLSLSRDKASGQSWLCAATNSGASAAHLTATANCCRVPGK